MNYEFFFKLFCNSGMLALCWHEVFHCCVIYRNKLVIRAHQLSFPQRRLKRKKEIFQAFWRTS